MGKTASDGARRAPGELQAMIISALVGDGGVTVSVIRQRVMAKCDATGTQVSKAVDYMGETGQLDRVLASRNYRYWAPGEAPEGIERDPDRTFIHRQFSLPPSMNHGVMNPLAWSMRHLLGHAA